MTFDIRPCKASDGLPLIQRCHGYKSAGTVATYAFGVYEDGAMVAFYQWTPPAPGAAKAVCPEAPYAVLALARMVAVPKAERRLKHVSKPLAAQMKRLIDRGRYPVLVTYSDASMGHTGYVYQCSGWTPTAKSTTRYFCTPDGARQSSYTSGRMRKGLVAAGETVLTRWEHRVCPVGETAKHVAAAGWTRVPIPGKVWRSGAAAYRWVRV